VTADNPSPWETAAVAEMRPVAGSIARKRTHATRLPVEDLSQVLLVAVVRACRKWAESSADPPPRPYLTTAMTNAVRDLQRRAAARDAVDHGASFDPEAPARVTDNRSAVDNAMSAAQVIALLRQHGVDVEALTIWAGGASSVEGGAELGVAPGTFRNRVSAARKKARDILGRLALYPP
jgi:DNA-directed RNA polymerase specialized sigma24 family protein